MNPDLNTLIKQKFGLHRGIYSNPSKENSIQAIEKAIDLRPLWVEFDVGLANNKELKTGHPPRRLVASFSKALSLFQNKETYPKIDLKIGEKRKYPQMINTILELINQYKIDFTLINISGTENRYQIIEAHNYLFKKIKNNPKIRLNVDLADLVNSKTLKREIDKETENHIKNSRNIIHSLSLEIHEEDWNKNAQFAEKHQIKNLYFWLRGWPEVLNPGVSKETIRKALELENKYNIEVYFDINPQYIESILPIDTPKQ